MQSEQMSCPQTQSGLLVSILPVIQFDKSFHQVVLYENYLICISININGT